MDFGFPSLDGFVAYGSNQAASQVSPIEANNQKVQHFRLARQKRPSGAWRTTSNMPGTADLSIPKTMILNYGAPLPPVPPFPSKDNYGLAERTSLNYTGFPHYQSSRICILIFKYLSASVLVPTELLTPLKRPFYFYPCGSSGGFYRPDLLGWGTLCRMGYMGSPLDFEPGRCRGTDGKKWQCSRDVVGDQKYYERHMNRGRYHAGKPADGQTVTAAVQTYNSNVVPATISISTPLITSKDPVNMITQQQSRNLEVATAVNMKSDEPTFTVPKPIEEESSDSFISSSKRRRYVNSRDCDEPFLSFSERETQDQHLLRHLIEDWPKDQCSCSAISWPEELKSDWTQLSMSTPMQEKIASYLESLILPK
ncbi:hypothetical protein P3X46_018633 [Hevea brasiliensis]|uniref:Growth-regulating factor n=1 Tax=Hevea brasiliensis TaxID=3981 RepID=A0ABQ9LTI3_HEVBR|nr:hypothetical protein P3X46_018633 [Hevea brasiliensis]